MKDLCASVEWILETHLHADHLTAAQYLKQQLGGKIGIGNRIKDVQKVFSHLFHTEDELKNGSDQFDILFDHNDTFHIGSLAAQAMHTPGHTPACMTYLIHNEQADLAFVGDTLFMPDYGTARCDFPGGDARTLFRSIQKLLALPESTYIFMCHDYRPNGRPLAFITSVKAQKRENIHVREGTSENTFVNMRETRDATLDMPVLILPSVQINMRGGNMPEPETNGIRYLKIPLNTL